jgi:hypothetical protein
MTPIFLAPGSTMVDGAYILTIYIFWKTVRDLRDKPEANMASERTLTLQRQFNRVLMVQVNGLLLKIFKIETDLPKNSH